MKITDSFSEIKTENTLELRERLTRRFLLMVLLVLSGVIIFYITAYGRPSDDPRPVLFSFGFGCVLISLGLFILLKRISIKIDKYQGTLLHSSFSYDFFYHPSEIPLKEISHIQIETLPSGRGPAYDVVSIITAKKDIRVYSGRNEFIVNNLSRILADFLECKILYNSKV